MKRLLVPAALLCALPASGDQMQLSQTAIDVLTPLDAPPSRADVDSAFSPTTALDNLVAIARDPTMDLGIQIHAIRMLPLYCPDAACGPGAVVHDTLSAIVNAYVAQLGQNPPAQLSATDQLRLRAAVEAIGATHSALPGDADLLLSRGLIDHDSRDVRVTVVRALRSLNSCTAANPLRIRLATDPSPQVKAAIHAALQALQCPS